MSDSETFRAHEFALQAVAEASMPKNGRRKRFRDLSRHAFETGDEPIGYARELERAGAIISRLYEMGFRVTKRRRNKEVD